MEELWVRKRVCDGGRRDGMGLDVEKEDDEEIGLLRGRMKGT